MNKAIRVISTNIEIISDHHQITDSDYKKDLMQMRSQKLGTFVHNTTTPLPLLGVASLVWGAWSSCMRGVARLYGGVAKLYNRHGKAYMRGVVKLYEGRNQALQWAWSGCMRASTYHMEVVSWGRTLSTVWEQSTNSGYTASSTDSWDSVTLT